MLYSFLNYTIPYWSPIRNDNCLRIAPGWNNSAAILELLMTETIKASFSVNKRSATEKKKHFPSLSYDRHHLISKNVISEKFSPEQNQPFFKSLVKYN